MNQCLGGRPRLLAAASPGERAGQSLVELALILPILLVIMLGALNVGLAIRAQLQLAQLSQQAAQYLVHHPTLSDADAGSNPATYSALVNYMKGLSSYQITPLQVTVTVGTSTNPSNTSCNTAHSCVQQDTVTVHYPFPLIFPLIGRLSVGMLRSGAIQLGATASTVAATHPVLPWKQGALPVTVCSVSPTQDCPDLKYKATGNNKTVGQHEILWNGPVEAGSLSLPLSYCIERQWWDNSTPNNILHDDKYYDGSDSPVNSLNCVAGHNGNGSSGAYMYFIDPTNFSSSGTQLGANGLSYTITTIQADGLRSPAISGAA